MKCTSHLLRLLVASAMVHGCSGEAPPGEVPPEVERLFSAALSSRALIAPPGAVGLEPRDGTGAFRLVVRPLDSADADRAVWASDVTCESHGAGPIGTDGDELAEVWTACEIPGVSGTVSIAAHYRRVDARETRMRVWMDNQLSDAAIVDATFVLRFAGDAMPTDPNDVYARFLLDEWVRDPMRNLRESEENTSPRACGRSVRRTARTAST